MIDGVFLLFTHTTLLVVFLLVPLYLYYKDRDKLSSYAVSLVFVVAVVYGLKYIFMVPRPEAAAIEVLTPRFPSGHTALIFTPPLFFRRWRCRLLFLLYGLIVAYTRLHFNVHVPIDLVTSVAIALVVSSFCLWKKDNLDRTVGYLRERF